MKLSIFLLLLCSCARDRVFEATGKEVDCHGDSWAPCVASACVNGYDHVEYPVFGGDTYKCRQASGACADESWLLATTAGSPDNAKCPNPLHHMRVQVATTPSNEEIGALVFCECDRSGTDAGTTDQ